MEYHPSYHPEEAEKAICGVTKEKPRLTTGDIAEIIHIYYGMPAVQALQMAQDVQIYGDNDTYVFHEEREVLMRCAYIEYMAFCDQIDSYLGLKAEAKDGKSD